MAKMQKEYRETLNIHPVIFYKKDLFELESLLIENNDLDNLEVSLDHNNTTFRAESIQELLSYCQELCMRESGGVPNFLNTIDKLYPFNDFT